MVGPDVAGIIMALVIYLHVLAEAVGQAFAAFAAFVCAAYANLIAVFAGYAGAFWVVYLSYRRRMQKPPTPPKPASLKISNPIDPRNLPRGMKALMQRAWRLECVIVEDTNFESQDMWSCVPNVKELVVDFKSDPTPAALEQLARFKKLELKISSATTTTLPDSIGNLSGLTTLIISSCKSLTTLPDSIGKLTGLTTLIIKDCKSLTTLPDSIGDLTGLTTLIINDCESLSLQDDDMFDITGLTGLKLAALPKAAVPKSIGILTSIHRPVLSFCESLKSLPKSIGNMISLKMLDLSVRKSPTSLPEEQQEPRSRSKMIDVSELISSGKSSLTRSKVAVQTTQLVLMPSNTELRQAMPAGKMGWLLAQVKLMQSSMRYVAADPRILFDALLVLIVLVVTYMFFMI